MENETQTTPETQHELMRWQRRLMPVMVILLFGLAIFFFASSYLQYQRMEEHIQQTASADGVAQALAAYERMPGVTQDFRYISWKSLTIQDDRAQMARYHRANAALLVSVWTRNLGFVTGMILSVVGASFVMAKLSEGTTAIDAGSGPTKASLTSSSPGIILAVLGTLLMMTAMSVRFDYESDETNLAATSEAARGADAPADATSNGTDDPGLDPPDWPGLNAAAN